MPTRWPDWLLVQLYHFASYIIVDCRCIILGLNKQNPVPIGTHLHILHFLCFEASAISSSISGSPQSESVSQLHPGKQNKNLWLIQSFVQHMISSSLLPGLRHLQSTQTFWPLQSSSWSQSQSANYAKCYLLGKVVLILLLTGFLGHPKLDLAPWAIVLIQSIMVATLVYTTGSRQQSLRPRMHLLKTPAATYLC